MIDIVDPLIAALIGAIVGLLVGSVIVASIRRPPGSDIPEPDAPPPVEDFAQILQVLRSGAVIVGEHDEILASNRAAQSLGVVKGTRIAIPAVLELVRTVRADAEVASLNIDLKGQTGRPRVQLAVRVTPLSNGLTFVAADDRAPALRAAESTRDFVANATHELKTPIGAISLLGEALEEASDDPAAVMRFAGKIRAESERLSVLVSQIITLSKLQGQSAMRSTDAVEVDDVVEHSMSRCTAMAKSRSVDLHVNGEEGLWVTGDADQLSTAITNLIQNAIAYSNPRARVVVTKRHVVSGDDEMVEIAVSDNGIGISPEDQKRIFERFYRVDYARSRETGGTGLGLSIVTEIAEGHGGEVDVWSKPGQGSTFTLRLPASAAEPDNQGEA